MIFFQKAVLGWYAFLLLLSIVASITVAFVDFLPGLFLTAIVYLFFIVGFAGGQPSINGIKKEIKFNLIKFPPKVVIVLAICLVAYTIKYYTGGDIGSVIRGLAAKESLYNNYQAYFQEENLGVFSFQKIPAILSNALIKFFVLYVYIRTISVSGYINWRGVAYVFSVSIIYLTFSIARGTSFELFELLVLCVFSLMMRSHIHGVKISRRTLVFVTLFAFFAVALYSYNISARYGFEEVAICSADQYCLDRGSVLYSLFPFAGDLSFKLSGYFLFGLFYLSQLINVLWDSSVQVIVSSFFPGMISFIGVDSVGLICRRTIDCGAMWIPDLAVIVVNFGFLGAIALIFLLGFVSRNVLGCIKKYGSFSSIIILYFVFLFMLSLPVGNFISVSSSNVLNLSFAIVLFLYKRFKFS